jgi:hypothetical protein
MEVLLPSLQSPAVAMLRGVWGAAKRRLQPLAPTKRCISSEVSNIHIHPKQNQSLSGEDWLLALLTQTGLPRRAVRFVQSRGRQWANRKHAEIIRAFHRCVNASRIDACQLLLRML